jgi:hypothetical protein
MKYLLLTIMKKLILLLLVSCSTQQPVEKPSEDVGEVFLLRSTLPKMQELLPLANCLIKLPEFKNEVEKLNYPNLGISGQEIYNKMVMKKPVTLTTYYKRTFRPVYAYTYLNHNEIYINTRYYNRSKESLLNTVMHEHTHTAGYAHGRHDPIPWDVGKIAEKVAKGCLSE